jgi:hypothetical protein
MKRAARSPKPSTNNHWGEVTGNSDIHSPGFRVKIFCTPKVIRTIGARRLLSPSVLKDREEAGGSIGSGYIGDF